MIYKNIHNNFYINIRNVKIRSVAVRCCLLLSLQVRRCRLTTSSTVGLCEDSLCQEIVVQTGPVGWIRHTFCVVTFHYKLLSLHLRSLSFLQEFGAGETDFSLRTVHDP